ncbi:hypothetical protein [uncultured Aeromicrobium sp.]|uniref:hypothetical protein n=1 Tax=uncultured Aeromicrobium sp. TaxID=337820 RepID=UPI0025DE175E|nr:hypothetical protein [uncultured Aeromicrobium sp.]
MFVPHGEEVTAVDTLENRHREAMEVAAVDITYLRIGGEAGPECTGASRAGVQAKSRTLSSASGSDHPATWAST